MKNTNQKLQKIKKAANLLALSSFQKRDLVLIEIANSLNKNETRILKENQKDILFIKSSSDLNTTSAFIDRLRLNHERLQQIIQSLHSVAQIKDPLESNLQPSKKLKNGLILKKKKSPIGVVFIIFESRPNVAIEAFSMGFKAGNAMILKGGKESFHTTEFFYKIIKKALEKYQLPESCLWGVPANDRETTQSLLKENKFIDVVIPRGGDKLIEYVTENSRIPIIKNDRGLCHAYIHFDANINMAINIIENGKIQRPSVCNSIETILIHEKIANQILPELYLRLNLETWFVCKTTKKILINKKNVYLANPKNWNTEYLDLKINCKIVKSDQEAIEHIQKYSSHHSETIITKTKKTAENFQNQIDSAVVYWNASTRFTDGFEFGFGGEIGISTQKLHVRGPVGLTALTTERWVVTGQGQIRR